MAAEPGHLATIAQLKEALLQRRTDDARTLLLRARHDPPGDPIALRTLAHAAVLLGDEAAAAELLAAAIRAHAPQPAPADWYRVLGEQCTSLGRLGEAIQAFRAALAGKPDDADTWRWLSRVLRRVDDLPAAIEACRRAVALAPQAGGALADLATVLADAGDADEAVALFDRAIAIDGEVPSLVVGRAKVDAQRGRRTEAIAALKACVGRHPENVQALAALALVLRDERRFDESIAVARRTIELVPHEAPFWCGLGRTLLQAGRAQEALEVAVALLARRPGHAGGLSLQALAYLALGDEAGARRLLDYPHFLARRPLPLPPGFAALGAFNVALAAVAGAHPTLHRAPQRHATAVGLHSGSILIDPPAPIVAFMQALRGAIDDYGRALPDWPEHPFVARRPRSYAVDMWCVVMEHGGHQIPHIHPEGWLSGCYYPALPDALRSDPGPEGWLAFGEPDRQFPLQTPPQIVRVRPEEGLLVLFPSYFFHRTVPFDTDGRRISVAFDVIPTDTAPERSP